MKKTDENLGYTRLLKELAVDRDLTVSYVKGAVENISSPDTQVEGLLALRLVAEAYGGLGAVAKATGVSRATVYRTFSAEGNPRLNTLVALLAIVGLRLSVEESNEPVTLRPLRSGAPKRLKDTRLTKSVEDDHEDTPTGDS